MKKAFVLGVLAIFAISICNVNAQNRSTTPQKKGVKVEETKKAEPKVSPNTNETPKDAKVGQEKSNVTTTGKAVDPKTPTTTPTTEPAKQEKTTKKDNTVSPNTNTTPKDVKVTMEKKDTPAKPKMTNDNKTTAPEKTTAPAKTTSNDRTATPQQKTGVNSLKKPIGKEKVATQQTTKKEVPSAEKEKKDTKNVNNSVPPKPKNDKQKGTANGKTNDIK